MEGGPHSILYFREGKASDKTLSKEPRRKLIDYIRENGVEPVVVRGLERFNFDDETVLPDRLVETTEDGQRHLKTVPYDEPIEIGNTSIRRYGPDLGIGAEQAGAVVLNTQKVRELSEKDRVAKLFIDHQPLTLVLDPERFYDQVGEIATDTVVIKPAKGRDSKDLLIARKKDLFDSEKFQVTQDESGLYLVGQGEVGVKIRLDTSAGYVMQEMVDTSKPFPRGIHIIESCQKPYELGIHNPKEVRLMIYWDATREDQQRIIPFARVFYPKEKTDTFVRNKSTHEDEWLLMDIEQGLPPDLDAMAKEVVAGMLEYGDVKYLHGAIDVAYDGNKWYLIELNVRYPLPPSYDEARQAGAEYLADVHRSSMGELLANSAKDAGKANRERQFRLET